MIFEGFGLAILNVLGIPPGVSLRKAEEGKKTSVFLQNNELINSIVEITADDVCLGSSPIYFACDKELPIHLKKKLDLMVDEFNSIAKWAAVDLLKVGVSLYKTEVSKENNLLLFPMIGEYKYYLTSDKKVRVFEEESDKEIKDVILFINYDKSSLIAIDKEEEDKQGKEFRFQIIPVPIQLKNVDKAGRDLEISERSMMSYRRQVSKLVRIIAVDIGISQGDKQQEIIDSVSSAINADSLSINTGDMFDDAIPVVPMRKGLGRPELIQANPDFNISEMADLDHNLGKVFLGLRFPKSYADFSQALDSTAVSTIRGDIRYSRMIDFARGTITDTINRFLASSDSLKVYGNLIALTELPTPEDEDVIAAMESFTDLSDKVFSSIVSDSESKEEAILKLNMLLTSLGGVASFKYIQKWTVLIRDYIEESFGADEEGSDIDPAGGAEGSDMEEGDFDPDDVAETDFGDDVEEVETQTEE